MNTKAILTSIAKALKETGDFFSIVKTNREINEAKGEIKRIELKRKELEIPKPQTNKVFIVHSGIEDKYKLKVCMQFVRNTLHLEPVVFLAEKHRYNPLYSFDNLARECSAAIIIYTTDPETQFPRRNIMLELGYFIGKFSNLKIRRIVILYGEDSIIASELYEIPHIKHYRSIKKSFFELQSEFKSWGFKIDN